MKTSFHIVPFIPCRKLRKGIKEFRKREARDPMYKVASFWIKHFWGKPKNVAEGLGVLLLTWNQAFYRFGRFDFKKLENFLKKYQRQIGELRKRDIDDFSDSDQFEIRILFNKLMDALQIPSGKSKGKKSPVATVKALHLLAPKFFPIWDDKIARAYNCKWQNSNKAVKKYIDFCYKIKEIVKKLGKCVNNKNVSILKLIDEYNYAKYTKKWI